MINVLSVENSLAWSWGLVFAELRDQLKEDYKISRIVRKPGKEIDKELLESFPVILTQNIDNIKLVNANRGNTVVRIGGMVIDDKNKSNRYNEELKQVGAVIATNSQLYDLSVAANNNTHLIPNGIDLDVFRPPNSRFDRPFTVGFAGNIWGAGGDYKGWKYYVQARLNMYGEVDHKECLHAGINKGQTQIDHDKMAEDFYHKIDCLILPSMGEGCSNVTGEALACGVPVLTTKVGYHGERLKHGHNCLFIERDATDIAKKVRLLKESIPLQMKLKKNGRKFVEENQDIKIIADKYNKVFQSILDRG